MQQSSSVTVSHVYELYTNTCAQLAVTELMLQVGPPKGSFGSLRLMTPKEFLEKTKVPSLSQVMLHFGYDETKQDLTVKDIKKIERYLYQPMYSWITHNLHSDHGPLLDLIRDRVKAQLWKQLGFNEELC